MNLTKKIAFNTIVQAFGKVVAIAVGLVSFSFIARYLGQTGYGFYTTVYGFLAVFGILVDLGLQMTTTQLISDPRNDESLILRNALTIRLVTSVLFLGLAPLVVLFFPYPGIIKVGVAVASLGFVFSALSSTITSLFQKHLITHQLAIAEISGKIISLFLLLLMIRFDLGLIGIILAMVTDTALVFFIQASFARRRSAISLAFDWLVWKKIFSATWPIALTIALNLMYFKGDIIILSLYRSQAEVGLYGAPYKILEVLITGIYLFLGLLLPLLTAAAATKNFERFRGVTQQAFDLICLAAAPLVVGAYLTGRPLMSLIAGETFAVSGDIFKILSLATAAIFLAALFGYAVVALNAQRQMIKYYALNAMISVWAYLTFIPVYGYWAAAWITVLSEAFILLTAWLVLWQQTRFLPRLGYAGKGVAASLGMGVVLWLLPTVHVTLTILSGAIFYGLILWLIRGIPHRFKELLPV